MSPDREPQTSRPQAAATNGLAYDRNDTPSLEVKLNLIRQEVSKMKPNAGKESRATFPAACRHLDEGIFLNDRFRCKGDIRCQALVEELANE